MTTAVLPSVLPSPLFLLYLSRKFATSQQYTWLKFVFPTGIYIATHSPNLFLFPDLPPASSTKELKYLLNQWTNCSINNQSIITNLENEVSRWFKTIISTRLNYEKVLILTHFCNPISQTGRAPRNLTSRWKASRLHIFPISKCQYQKITRHTKTNKTLGAKINSKHNRGHITSSIFCLLVFGSFLPLFTEREKPENYTYRTSCQLESVRLLQREALAGN